MRRLAWLRGGWRGGPVDVTVSRELVVFTNPGCGG